MEASFLRHQSLWLPPMLAAHAQFLPPGSPRSPSAVLRRYTPRGSSCGAKPRDFDVERSHWRSAAPAAGEPWWWDWVCPGSCGIMAEALLEVAREARPGGEWRVVSSEGERDPWHACVWDGSNLIFELQYLAMFPSMSAQETFEAAGGPAARRRDLERKRGEGTRDPFVAEEERRRGRPQSERERAAGLLEMVREPPEVRDGVIY
ncbi:hypothetical protein TeGR_g10073 [Tetraparma gracilis]|uniref:Uncharacterized protein n=1 Tax=Tetraparma gracilis TaxID=2962635 RepID=A0ABQ6NAV5_9STRA|nr:hypothetical protein TeGR_g10073 [Tetraparma gracilis]